MNNIKNNLKLSKHFKGFTLIEIMLALGVMGIGVVMVATLFPPAVMQAKKADENTLAIIMGDNARAILDTRISFLQEHLRQTGNPDGHYLLQNPRIGTYPHGRISAGHSFSASNPYEFMEVPIGTNGLGDIDGDIIHYDDSLYRSRKNAGWRALVRNISNGVNDNKYQFVIISYVMPPTYDITDSSFQQKWFQRDMYLVHVWDDSSSMHGLRSINADTKVTIRQTEFDGTIMLVEKDGNSESDVPWLAVGSPVILDGRVNADRDYLGRYPRIVNIRDWEDDDDYWACQLSEPFFDENHPQTAAADVDGDGDNYNDFEGERGVWVFRADSFGARSPAIGVYVYNTIID